MNEITYKKEELFLSPYAKKSCQTEGRQKQEEEKESIFRTAFQRDRDRIIHSKAFRRLKNKTQVFLLPEGDHYRTRLTHTLDVTQIARTIARAINLNEDLVEAIALGHDLGHTPFGHTGERILNKLSGHFLHNEQSLRVVDYLENDSFGLNLTMEVRDGILNHRKNDNPKTLEGKVVSLADRIAYINHDIDDSIRAKILSERDLPAKEIKLLGATARQRVDNMVSSIVEFSNGKNFVGMPDQIKTATDSLRDFMTERVYLKGVAKVEDVKVNRLVEVLYDYFIKNVDALEPIYKKRIEQDGKDKVVCDYISGMTDTYAIYVFENIFVPSGWLIEKI